ncbi:HTH cro/C1-type domain-containing protein [Candidatus Ornithobacterium hominis]|uniref:XRE family transcriptional regulator n=1 Tax=Candidatus Ornithobacterium hominis TaxID=2497989 RepID=UPI0024BC1EBD|nr:XRE family transcriptional regulator [Candidatus Ornithobacterium hominis]CAI9429729.1 HTH cro/C1-type domain-containing protein [Candidatus Ornithobacterium hominis]
MYKNKTLGERLRDKYPSYSEIAKKHNTNIGYVSDIARGVRNPIRGKGLRIKKELEKYANQ